MEERSRPNLPTRREFLTTAAGAFVLPMALGRFSRPTLSPKPMTPLDRAAFLPLPLGAVLPRGWVERQLRLQRDGLTGNAPRLLPAAGATSAWRGGDGENWEKGPYYLRGLVGLARLLEDEELTQEAEAWIRPILDSQRPDGWFGPANNDDWWPRMVVTHVLRDHAQATGDPRVIPFLERYYGFMRAHIEARPLSDWGRARAGDEVDVLLWLHRETRNPDLLDLADVLFRQALPWSRIARDNSYLDSPNDFHPTHNVNVPQGLKLPVLAWLRTGREEEREAYRAALTHLNRDHGTPFGIHAGSERLSGRSTLAGVETCTTVEYLLSAGHALRAFGEARIGDEIEAAAFNALPAATSAPFRQHVYYTLANSATAKKGVLGFTDDHGNDLVLSPISGFPCCCYNLHMGWPKLVQNAWAVHRDGALACLTLLPGEVRHEGWHLLCETDYPFDDRIRIRVLGAGAGPRELLLRRPGWCDAPSLSLNGAPLPLGERDGFLSVAREWREGDELTLRVPMRPVVRRGTLRTASVHCGPLAFSLPVEERWVRQSEDVPAFGTFEVEPASAWNVALEADEEMALKRHPVPEVPFETGRPGSTVSARVRRVPEWTLRADGLGAHEPPLSPVASDEPAETVELVPFGSQRLRITAFPVVGRAQAPLTEGRFEFAGPLSDEWIAYEGGWVAGRTLRLAHLAKAIHFGTRFADGVVSTRMRVGARGDAGLLLRVADPSVGTDHYRGVYVGVDPGQGRLLAGTSDYRWRELASAPCAVAPDTDFVLRVEASGVEVTVFLNDEKTPVLTFPCEAPPSGHVGLRSHADMAAFYWLQFRM